MRTKCASVAARYARVEHINQRYAVRQSALSTRVRRLWRVVVVVVVVVFIISTIWRLDLCRVWLAAAAAVTAAHS